jgi:alpha-L-fucosidase
MALGILITGCGSTGETGTAENNYWMEGKPLPEPLSQDWERMHASKQDVLEKFNDDKLGMFIHWGLYSLTSGEWKGQRVPGLGEWIMYHAMIPRDEYAALAGQFNPTEFDAAEWVSLAKNAGMKYIVITSKHHDGFALFPSQHSSFNIAEMTPSQLLPLDLLYEECQRQGIGLGLYYSHVIDWYDGWPGEGGSPDGKKTNPMNTWDPPEVTRTGYFEDKSYPQVEELLERYPKLYSIWFDYWYKEKYINPAESYRFYKAIYDVQPECLVNSRVGHGLGDYITAGDNMILESGQTKHWETPGTLNNTWGYSKFDDDWKSEKELIFWIVNIVSRGGNYLLNIGPKPDGSIPAGTTAGFVAIGRWMDINREAVYGSEAWEVVHEGPAELSIEGTTDRAEKGFSDEFASEDFWFTAKDGAVYAFALEWPDDRKALIKSVTAQRVGEIETVSLLGHGELQGWNVGDTGLSVSLPDKDLGTVGYVLKIENNRSAN